MLLLSINFSSCKAHMVTLEHKHILFKTENRKLPLNRCAMRNKNWWSELSDTQNHINDLFTTQHKNPRVVNMHFLHTRTSAQTTEQFTLELSITDSILSI